MSKSIELYNKFAPYYREYSNKKNSYLKSLDNIIINFINSQRAALSKHPLKMLDIGSGDGKRAIHIATRLKTQALTLLDNSPEMVKLCTEIPGARALMEDISAENFLLEEKNYQIITCLWNVLGHLASPQEREVGLRNIYTLLSEDGFLFLDVNNRYNIKNYGIKNVFRNLLKDMFSPSASNGDINFEIEINESRKIPANVHIFNPHEIDFLLKKAGFKIINKYYVDYSTGKITASFLTGQIFYILKK